METAHGLRENAGHDIRLGGSLSGTRRYWHFFVYHATLPTVTVSGNPADEHAPHALLQKTRVDEGPKQDPADLPIETGHLRGVSGGELHTRCIHEQILDARERLFETPCLERLRHVQCSPQFRRYRPPASETGRRARPFVDVCGACVRPSPPASCRALMKADA